MYSFPQTSSARRPKTALRIGIAAAATAATLGTAATPAIAHEVAPAKVLEVAPSKAAGLGTPADLADAITQNTMYVVVTGDSLSTIAARHGLDELDGWRRIFDANLELTNPNLIYAGQELRIPQPDETLESRVVAAPPARRATRASRTTTSASAGSQAPAVAGDGVWDRLAACESGGNWSINTGNGYKGGLQFHPQTWTGFGGGAYAASADQATREQQIAVAQKVQAKQGWGAWPACSRKIGLR